MNYSFQTEIKSIQWQ